MDTNYLDHDLTTGKGYSFSQQTRSNLLSISKWGKFLSIAGFFFIALILVFAGLFWMTMKNSEMMVPLPFPVGYFSLFYLIIALIYLPPVIFLFNFSKDLGSALSSGSEILAERSIRNLKKLFAFMGVFTLIVIGINAIIVLFTIIDTVL